MNDPRPIRMECPNPRCASHRGATIQGLTFERIAGIELSIHGEEIEHRLLYRCLVCGVVIDPRTLKSFSVPAQDV